jgi:hypothetical protein
LVYDTDFDAPNVYFDNFVYPAILMPNKQSNKQKRNTSKLNPIANKTKHDADDPSLGR